MRLSRSHVGDPLMLTIGQLQLLRLQKSKSKCCNCCHDDVQTIDKEKAKAVLVETLDSKKASFPRTFAYRF